TGERPARVGARRRARLVHGDGAFVGQGDRRYAAVDVGHHPALGVARVGPVRRLVRHGVDIDDVALVLTVGDADDEELVGARPDPPARRPVDRALGDAV